MVNFNSNSSVADASFDFGGEGFEWIETEGIYSYCIINRNDPELYQGFLKNQKSSEMKLSSFFRVKDEQEARRMCECFIDFHHKNISRCYGRFLHQDKEWLVAFDSFEPIISYFSREKNYWESKSCQGSIADKKASWWNHIKDDITNIWPELNRALCTLIDNEKFINQGTIYTNNPEKCFMMSTIESHVSVKFLPNGEANDSKGIDIDKVRQFLSHLIGLPFGLNDVAADSDFKLPNELLFFLRNLSSDNLKFVGPKFLLGAPIGWLENEGPKFIMNLDDLLKRHVINKKFLEKNLQCCHEAANWASSLANDDVLLAIYKFPGSNGTTAKYEFLVDVVRFCSNVYRHYNEENCKGVRTEFLGWAEIEKKLRAAIPNLYVNLYDALLLYAKSNPIKQEAIFEKLLSSEDL